MLWITKVFNVSKPIIGVVHLLPLPGSPGYDYNLDKIFATAREAAKTFLNSGFDGLMFENFSDVPFYPDSVEPHVVGIISILLNEFSKLAPCGVNILRNAAHDSVAAAFAGGGQYIRVNVHTGAAVTDQGLIQGKAYETLRYMKRINSTVRILADIHVKHAVPLALRDPVTEAKDCIERGLADALIITGSRTGEPADINHVKEIKSALPEIPVFIGSGASEENIALTLKESDGVIVSTSLEKSIGVINSRKAAAFVKEARQIL